MTVSKPALFFFIEILSRVSLNWSDIVDKITIYDTDKNDYQVRGKDIKWSLIPSEYPNCQLLKYSDLNFNMGTPEFLTFAFKNEYKDIGISLKLMDINKVLRKRSLRSQVGDYIGPPIVLEDLSIKASKRFYLTIKQRVNFIGEPGIVCHSDSQIGA